MNLEHTIMLVQQALGVTVDGRAGPQTWAAIARRILPQFVDPAWQADLCSERSERIIATLHEHARPYARALVHKAAAAGIRIEVISGHRTYEEQAELYAQGRTKPGKIVTYAPPGYSEHNFGIAWDVGVFTEDGRYADDLAEAGQYDSRLLERQYAAVGALSMELGNFWGGTWIRPVDAPHHRATPDWGGGLPEEALLKELRRRHAAGIDPYAHE